MLGWLILFALLAAIGTALMLVGYPGDASMGIASSVFALLFLLGLLTRAARDRAW